MSLISAPLSGVEPRRCGLRVYGAGAAAMAAMKARHFLLRFLREALQELARSDASVTHDRVGWCGALWVKREADTSTGRPEL